MIKNSIGENAGKVWKALDENSGLSINELKEITKLDSNDLLLSLGWLSKENKVLFYEDGDEQKICLIEN
ncbi:MAG: winged helix-turn-helix domain-containing protein [Bacteroidetes bacterium]|nr:winged helix-turn-helix domain-containing protein [Bacteroidota bacterium]